MRVGIYGYGEVGSTIGELVKAAGHSLTIWDPALNYKDLLGTAEVVHICTPAQSVRLCAVSSPRDAIIVVHSTVAPGTCSWLALHGEVGVTRLFHAPVRGTHPNLGDSLRSFVMPLGGPTEAPTSHTAVLQAYLATLGIVTSYWGMWQNTELAKIMCTTRLGLEVLFMRHIHDLCRKNNADFDKVYTEWTRTYNTGYQVMRSPKFTRPILTPVPGKIGGHCVMSNAHLMAEDSWIAKIVAQEGNKDWGS